MVRKTPDVTYQCVTMSDTEAAARHVVTLMCHLALAIQRKKCRFTVTLTVTCVTETLKDTRVSLRYKDTRVSLRYKDTRVS